MTAQLDATRFISLPISSLVKATWNYKVDDIELKEKLKENLKRNGQLENIVVRELDEGKYEIVNGNHRYDAFAELEWSVVMCFNLGKVSQSVAQRIAIELNETRFGTDKIRLAELIKGMTTDFTLEDLATSMPFEMKDLSAMVTLTSFSFDQFSPKPPVIEGGDGRRLIIDMDKELAAKWLQWRELSNSRNDIEALVKLLELQPDFSITD